MKDRTEEYIDRINKAKTTKEILAILNDVIYRGALHDHGVRHTMDADYMAVQRAAAERLEIKRGGDQ